MPPMADQVVVIPAHGRGTRLQDVTGGRPKTLVPVAGEPILGRLLRSLFRCADGGAAVSTIVYTRQSDTEIPAFLAAHAGGVEVGRREPQGYLRDIVDISQDVGEEFTVIDCDLIAPCAELASFLTQAGSAEPGSDTWARPAMVFGVSAHPPSADPRSIRPTALDGVLGLGPGTASWLPRAIGAYRWSPAAVDRASRFVAESTRAQSPGTFHDYVRCLADERAPATLIGFSSALNVNTRAELDLAATFVRGWREQGVD
jgi:GTP:adenosylcobinamide-phosphate guanylyltransferase